MKVIWKKLDLKLWYNVSFKYFLSLEIQLYYQKNVLEWKISWVTSSHLGQWEHWHPCWKRGRILLGTGGILLLMVRSLPLLNHRWQICPTPLLSFSSISSLGYYFENALTWRLNPTYARFGCFIKYHCTWATLAQIKLFFIFSNLRKVIFFQCTS